MNRQTKGTIFLAVGIVFVVMLIAGCEEELSDVKKHRIIASENIQLKKQLTQLEVEIKQEKALLEECEQAKKVASEKPENVEEMLGVVDDVLAVNKALSEENEKLKARVQELETKIEQLGEEPPEMEEEPTP